MFLYFLCCSIDQYEGFWKIRVFKIEIKLNYFRALDHASYVYIHHASYSFLKFHVILCSNSI